MSDMVERVAKAIIAKGQTSAATGLARAAIEAMKEPTPEMVEAACAECDGLLFAGDLPVKNMWQVMIVKALR